MEIDIKKLSSRELHLVYYKAKIRFADAHTAILQAGRGNERPSETKAKSDPLSVEYTKAEKEVLAIIDERDRRMNCHGNFRPIKEQATA
jgi:hypothetical protein